MSRYAIGVLICLMANGVLAQIKTISTPLDTVWTITGWRELGHQYTRWKTDFLLDARQTIIGESNARIGGLRIGLENRRVHRFGLGFYGMDKVVRVGELNAISGNIDQADMRLSYTSLFYERVLFFNRRFEWSATAHLGRGKIRGSYHIIGTNSMIDFDPIRVYPVEFSSTGYYNFTYWMSFGVGLGYRTFTTAPNDFVEPFKGPIAVARLRIKVLKLVRSIWNKDLRIQY